MSSTITAKLGIDSIHGDHRYATGVVITRACSLGHDADTCGKRNTLAATAASIHAYINANVASSKVNANIGGPVNIIVDTTEDTANHMPTDGTTDSLRKTDKNAVEDDYPKDNHEYSKGAKVQPGEERCGLNSAAAMGGDRPQTCKYVKTKTADNEHGEAAAIATAESWSSRRCSQRICKLRPALITMPPPLKAHTSKCDEHHVKMLTKSSYNNSDKNNNVGAVLHGWLQGMRETSPPRTTSPTATASSSPFQMNPHIHAATSNEDSELMHRAWMLKHPSALDKMEEIVEAASGKRVAIFLDYDGTLSPIVEDPDRAFMSHQMRAIVKEVANVFPTAIISGRCKEKLHEFVQLPELYYAGSHGMEIVGPARHLEETRPAHSKGNEVVLFQPAKEFTYIIDKVYKVLVEKTKGVPGARVENNKFCVSVHFRCVKETHWMALAEQVQQVLQSFPNIRLTQGRKVLEIRPLIAWNKGKALDFLLKALGLNDQNSVFPIYFGDDRSDEDAFKVLNRKKHGLGILVTTAAKETNAVCSLRDPSEVGELLKNLVKWKRRRLNKYL